MKRKTSLKNTLQSCVVSLNGDIFNIDKTVFAKNISADGEIRMTGLTESIALIAIDKHGNESKLLIIVTGG